MVLYSMASSAKSLIVVCGNILIPMSFTYSRNISGPTTVPSGTPERTGESVEAVPSKTTLLEVTQPRLNPLVGLAGDTIMLQL